MVMGLFSFGGGASAQSGSSLEGRRAPDMVKRRADEEQEAEERAAAKIQAGYRGYRVRKEMKTDQAERGSAGGDQVEAAAATKIQAGVRGFLVRRRNLKEEQGKGPGARGHARKTPPDQ